jgi:hypothetical protein
MPSIYSETYTCACLSIDVVGYHCEVDLGLMHKDDFSVAPGDAQGRLIGPGWILVRRVQAGATWHPANDQLRGTDVYGPDGAAESPAQAAMLAASRPDADQAAATFSVAFDDLDFNQFLLESGDRTQWLIMDKKEIDDCDAIVASGTDRPWQPWHPTIRHSSATVDGGCEACEPAGTDNEGHQWTKVNAGTVGDSNIHLWGPSCSDRRPTCLNGLTGKYESTEPVDLQFCKEKCAAFDGSINADLTPNPENNGPFCYAFEFGGGYCVPGVDGVRACNTLYHNGDCQPQYQTSQPILYNGKEWNLDLFVKGSSAKMKANSGYSVQQYCRPNVLEDPWISVSEHPADIVYGEGGYGGNSVDQAISHGGANVWIRKLPECAIGHRPKIGDDGRFIRTPHYMAGRNEPYACEPDTQYTTFKDTYGGHEHLATYEDPNPNGPIGAGWYLVRRTDTAMWHKATDALSGTAIYGSFDPSPTSQTSFSIPFVHWDFSQFLFASDDFTQWMIMNKVTIGVFHPSALK